MNPISCFLFFFFLTLQFRVKFALGSRPSQSRIFKDPSMLNTTRHMCPAMASTSSSHDPWCLHVNLTPTPALLLSKFSRIPKDSTRGIAPGGTRKCPFDSGPGDHFPHTSKSLKKNWPENTLEKNRFREA
ncbi:hypothetical protein DFH07DRAFT_771697 [Mycena maculata]|uniref:Secreted protein n=1 Tax=Mycena maculata TaxID=230809 RepID=A0AAD7NH67_9AGAR|nr:hypothetical protein DFH07DRAFT_771697 [Mycena maculata]